MSINHFNIISTGFPSCKIICGLDCNGIVDLNTSVLIGKKSFSKEFLFNFVYSDGIISIGCYSGVYYVLRCILKHHSGQKQIVMIQGATGHHGQSQQLTIMDNLNNNRSITDVLKPEVDMVFQ